MKLHFKPMPWLTFVTLICLVILISLGTWQYKRLQWKTALLAEVEAAANAAPFTSFAEIQNALSSGEPVDFRRFGADAKAVPDAEAFLVFSSSKKDVSWRVFAPMVNQGVTAFAGLGIISDDMKSKPISFTSAPRNLVGYVRRARPRTRGSVKSTPEENRWFAFNPLPESHDWADMAGIDAEMGFYIDALPEATDANVLPAKRPNIRNNHLDYMLTWYSFAVIMLIIYGILHKRAGRLGVRRNEG